MLICGLILVVCDDLRVVQACVRPTHIFLKTQIKVWKNALRKLREAAVLPKWVFLIQYEQLLLRISGIIYVYPFGVAAMIGRYIDCYWIAIGTLDKNRRDEER